MTSTTEHLKSKTSQFLNIKFRGLQVSFERLNSALAQSTGQLWHFLNWPSIPYVGFYILPQIRYLGYNFGNRNARKSIKPFKDQDYSLV